MGRGSCTTNCASHNNRNCNVKKAQKEQSVAGKVKATVEATVFLEPSIQLNMDCGFLGMNLYAYCLNNPISYKGSNGERPVAGTTIDGETPDERGESIKHAKENTPKRRTKLPTKGEPGSSDVLQNPDGSIKQKRWYGPDGNAVRDRAYNHPGDMEFPHDHTWNNGERDKNHLPVSPDYEFEMDKLTNGLIVFACGAGIFMIAVLKK